jgi:hypothetical protein
MQFNDYVPVNLRIFPSVRYSDEPPKADWLEYAGKYVSVERVPLVNCINEHT